MLEQSAIHYWPRIKVVLAHTEINENSIRVMRDFLCFIYSFHIISLIHSYLGAKGNDFEPYTWKMILTPFQFFLLLCLWNFPLHKFQKLQSIDQSIHLLDIWCRTLSALLRSLNLTLCWDFICFCIMLLSYAWYNIWHWLAYICVFQ